MAGDEKTRHTAQRGEGGEKKAQKSQINPIGFLESGERAAGDAASDDLQKPRSPR